MITVAWQVRRICQPCGRDATAPKYNNGRRGGGVIARPDAFCAWPQGLRGCFAIGQFAFTPAR